jgi:hypothetical protein
MAGSCVEWDPQNKKPALDPPASKRASVSLEKGLQETALVPILAPSLALIVRLRFDGPSLTAYHHVFAFRFLDRFRATACEARVTSPSKSPTAVQARPAVDARLQRLFSLFPLATKRRRKWLPSASQSRAPSFSPSLIERLQDALSAISSGVFQHPPPFIPTPLPRSPSTYLFQSHLSKNSNLSLPRIGISQIEHHLNLLEA